VPGNGEKPACIFAICGGDRRVLSSKRNERIVRNSRFSALD
jgi:hypothetical protein